MCAVREILISVVAVHRKNWESVRMEDSSASHGFACLSSSLPQRFWGVNGFTIEIQCAALPRFWRKIGHGEGTYPVFRSTTFFSLYMCINSEACVLTVYMCINSENDVPISFLAFGVSSLNLAYLAFHWFKNKENIYKKWNWRGDESNFTRCERFYIFLILKRYRVTSEFVENSLSTWSSADSW